jgi:glycosyltransferase involved in cell wall biosynthesis
LESIIEKGKLLKKVEIIIVDDGSKDKTLSLIIDYTSKYTPDKSVVVRGF